MMFIFYNPNPKKVLVGDCVIRAISKALNKVWEDTYIDLATQGFSMYDMPSSNEVWGSYLRNKHFITKTPKNFTSINQFCIDNPVGTFILATGSHVVTVVDGDYYDTWDSGDEIVAYYFIKEDYYD